MRPVRRGAAPQPSDYANYRTALTDLVSRLGRYCSYCERPVATQLAVEHVQPKGLAAYAHLVGRWENFLLACVNCNSTKGDDDVRFDALLFPDRDNTFLAFDYPDDGGARPAASLDPSLVPIAQATLALTGLDKPLANTLDGNGQLVALDRVAQRLEARAVAARARHHHDAHPTLAPLTDAIVALARATGYFSIWMHAFAGAPAMQRRLVQAFPGTALSGCFDATTAAPVSPAPNPDALAHGGKV